MGTTIIAVLLSAYICGSAGEKWHWPEETAESVRIDSKLRFNDKDDPRNRYHERTQQADTPFIRVESSETPDFYNRPSASGRFRVQGLPKPVNKQARLPANTVLTVFGNNRQDRIYDGTLDSLDYCKCVSQPDCVSSPNIKNACPSGSYLCCYKRPNKHIQDTEYFNEVDGERPILLPGQGVVNGPFPPPPNTILDGQFGPGHGHEEGLIGNIDKNQKKTAILTGPEGLTGNVGPPKKFVLVGPNGPTGGIGPDLEDSNGNKASNGAIEASESAQRGVLVGPGGPTGIIGPGYRRPVLFGPRGPTGIFGTGRRPGILVGPGGPTGVIGPGYRQNPGILVGPGGPTGQIGPRRPSYFYNDNNYDY